jgi:GNAT superfamily N-acetyltransferase
VSVELRFADLELARRVEAAWDWLGVENVSALARLFPHSFAEVLPVAGGHAAFLGTGSPLSQAQGLGLNGPVSEEAMELMERFFRDRGSATQIEVSSLAEPAFLADLSRRGYLIQEQTHTLVRDLTPSDHEQSAPLARSLPSPTVEINQVAQDDISAWIDLLFRSFFDDPASAPDTLRDGAIAMTKVPGVTAWIARVEGQAAGAGSLAIRQGVALMCGDGSLPQYRRRGVQSALLRARLEYALVAGCDLAAICTQPGSGSQRNAERQGFKMAYSRTMMIRE